MTASSAVVLGNLAYLIGAVVLAIIGGLIVWLRHRSPQSISANVESFHRGLQALAPNANQSRPGRAVSATATGGLRIQPKHLAEPDHDGPGEDDPAAVAVIRANGSTPHDAPDHQVDAEGYASGVPAEPNGSTASHPADRASSNGSTGLHPADLAPGNGSTVAPPTDEAMRNGSTGLHPADLAPRNGSTVPPPAELAPGNGSTGPRPMGLHRTNGSTGPRPAAPDLPEPTSAPPIDAIDGSGSERPMERRAGAETG